MVTRSLSSAFVASVSPLQSHSGAAGGPVSAHDEEDDKSDEVYNVTCADSKLEGDTLHEISIETINWAERSCGSKSIFQQQDKTITTTSQHSTPSKKITRKQTTAFANRTGSDTMTVAGGALLPPRISRCE
jgi:acetyl-CoA carboxylase carboxyltransferase component